MKIKTEAPHLVQYQGSKRILAPLILQYMPERFNRLLEPFSGVASISIAAATAKRSAKFHINDINAVLINMLREVIEKPENLISEYSRLWHEQFEYPHGHVQHFYFIREKFNNGEQTPPVMLYLLARCVKGSIRYGKNGKFNQSPDKRRHGTNPENMCLNIKSISYLLKDKAICTSLDYKQIFDIAGPGDLLYMDPPYQGVCENRDNRYFSGISHEDFSNALQELNLKKIDYLISYDGQCGTISYGKELPESLGCKKILLDAGVSTQATLLGRRAVTKEALYISKNLYEEFLRRKNILQLSLI